MSHAVERSQISEKPGDSRHSPSHPLDLGIHHSTRLPRKTLLVIGFIVIVLLLIRLALPYAVERYVNHQLNRNNDYDGKGGNIWVSLWRGAYVIKDIHIYKRSGAIKEPFFAAPTVDLSVQWRELFHGAVVAKIQMDQPRLNFVSGPTADQTQTGTNVAWDQTLSSLSPFKINRFGISDGEIHFQNRSSTPPVDIYLNHLDAVATNLNNSRKLRMPLPAGLMAHCTTLGKGDANLQLHMNPMASLPTYELVCQLSNVDLTALNDFFKAYGKFDVKRGTFELYASVASTNGNYEGYIKNFFNDIDVFEWQVDKKKTPVKIAWQAMVQAAAFVFKNHPRDSIATKVPISGTYQKNEVGTWTAVANLLQNAFIHALTPKVDQKISINQVSTNSVAPPKPIKPARNNTK